MTDKGMMLRVVHKLSIYDCENEKSIIELYILQMEAMGWDDMMDCGYIGVGVGDSVMEMVLEMALAMVLAIL